MYICACMQIHDSDIVCGDEYQHDVDEHRYRCEYNYEGYEGYEGCNGWGDESKGCWQELWSKPKPTEASP